MNTFNLQATHHTSRVLANWANSRPGAARRMEDVGNGAQLVRVQNSAVYSTVSSDTTAMDALFQPLPTASGMAVNDKTAMAVTTVFACLSKLAGAKCRSSMLGP